MSYYDCDYIAPGNFNNALAICVVERVATYLINFLMYGGVVTWVHVRCSDESMKFLTWHLEQQVDKIVRNIKAKTSKYE